MDNIYYDRSVYEEAKSNKFKSKAMKKSLEKFNISNEPTGDENVDAKSWKEKVAKLTRLMGSKLFTDFCNETTIHGFNHIVAPRRHPLEKFGWAAATVLAVLGAIQLCMQQWQRYVANPTVVSLEKDYRTWNNTFLALTACLEKKIWSSSAITLIQQLWGVREGEDKFEYYMGFLEVVANSTLLNFDKFTQYSNDKTLEDVNLLEIALQVVLPFKGIVAWFDRDINTTFVNVMTELGVCYTINSVVSKDQAVKLSSSRNDPPSPIPITCEYITHPCYMRVELYQMCTKYYTHSPYEIIDHSSNMLTTVCPGEDLNSDWKVVETKASDDVRALAIDQRNCRFYTEPSSQKHEVYSGGVCRRECRNRLALKLCGCRPYFYFQESGKLCNSVGMACLVKYKTMLSQHQDCKCLPQCLDATYELASSKESRWSGPFSERSSVKIGILPPRSRYRRQILFCFEDLVVSFGGAAGLFLGCSFLSGVEIIYFVLERGFSGIFKIFSKKKNENQTGQSTESTNLRRRQNVNLDELKTIKEQERYELNKYINNIAEYE